MMPFECGECGRLCRDNYNLKKHALTHAREWCTCFHCGKKLCGKESVRSHINKFHLSPVAGSKTVHLIRCCLCSFNSASVSEMELHLTVDHQLNLEEESKTFETKEEFLIWKERLESETNTLYVKRRSDRGKRTIVSNFYCHRSGNARVKPASQRKRSLRVLGPNKTGYFCPARINVKITSDGKVFTKGVYKHVGHDFCSERMPLKKSFRLEIAQQFLSKNIPFQETIRQARKSIAENGVLSREYLLSRKDLHNISRDLHVEQHVKRHSDDGISVQMWMEDYKDLVRYSKLQGQTDTDHPNLKENDFLLILMNESQIKVLKRFGPKVVCMDGTHGTNGYHCELTTIMVLNENKEGIPCAFLFSNRVDTGIVNFFLTKVSESTGPIPCQVFMSDTTEMYFTAWSSTMGRPLHHLYCSWHVNQTWLKHRSLISGDQSLKDKIFEKLKIISIERDESSFNIMFQTFLTELSHNQHTLKFGEYIKRYYAPKVQCWAYCYRKNLSVYTNTHLERMHGVLEHIYMKVKKIKRLDKAIYAVTSLLDDKLLSPLITHHRGYYSKRIQDLRKRHSTAESGNMTIISWAHHEWIVSSSDFSEMYTVQQIKTYCDEERCGLLCEPCGACFHMYLCSCRDSAITSNMCKHIHLVCLSQRKSLTISSAGPSFIIETPDDDMFETSQSAEEMDGIVVIDVARKASRSCLWRERIISEMKDVLLQAKTDEHFEAIHSATLSLKAIFAASPREDI